MALKVKTYNNVQANVTFSKASSRVAINPINDEAATENIALTLGKISKWYDSLVPTGGSSGKFLGWNSSGTAKWVDAPTYNDVNMSQTLKTDNVNRPLLMSIESTSNTTATVTTTGARNNSMYGNVSTGLIFCRGREISNVTVKTGSTAQSHITLNTLMTWLITSKQYIPSGKYCHVVLTTAWDYANSDILQVSINGTNYEIQLAGVIIEFMGSATSYNAGTFRLLIHSSPTTSFTAATGYTKFPTATIAEYTCNGSSYSPVWKMMLNAHPTITVSADTTSSTPLSHGGTFTAITSVTRDSNGHTTKVNTATYTLPSDNNTTYTFATGDAVGQFKVKASTASSYTNYNVNGISAGTDSGTANLLAYYSTATKISSTPKIAYHEINSTASTPVQRNILHLFGAGVGNDAPNLISGTVGIIGYGDGGPQINFNTAGTDTITGGQNGAIIFTDHDSAAPGVSWHFVSDQDDWNVISKRFHAKTSISIGTDKPPSTAYTFYVTGSSYYTGDIVIGTSGSSSNDTGDIIWKHGNGNEKARIWFDDTYTAKQGPRFRLYKSDGTSLYSGYLPLADGTSASGTWGISITGTAASANKLNTNAGSTNRPVYFSGGIPVICDTPVSGKWWNGVPYVGNNGVLEIGKYIDFHGTDTTTADYDYRLQAGSAWLDLVSPTTQNKITVVSPDYSVIQFMTTKTGYATNQAVIYAYPLTTYGLSVLFQSGGNTVIGGGESASTLYTNDYDSMTTAENESLYLASDSSEIHLITNAQSYSTRKVLKVADGQLVKSGGLWIAARDNAPVYANKPNAQDGGYYPAWFAKSKSGGWSMGVLSAQDNLYITYTTDADYSASPQQNQNTYQIQFQNKSGTVALTSDIPTVPTVNNASLTLKGAGTTVTTFTANASTNQSLDIVAGTNVTITPDATNHKITIASSYTNTDTKVTQTAVGSTYTNYRPLVISASNADSAPPTATTVTDGTFITSSIYCQPSSGSVYATKFVGPLQGNADTATKWKTARTLTIGSTGKSVDGSGNVSWSLSEIGAASSTHTHNYADSPSAGGAATWAYVPRVNKNANTALAGANKGIIEEYNAESANIPSAHWYFVQSLQGGDTRYGSQLAIGMTVTRLYYRRYYVDGSSSTWSSWQPIGRFTETPTSGKVVITDGTTGGVKSTDYVTIANGGTGATTRLNALKNLTNENVGTSAQFFLTITNSWGKGGYTTVADAKTVLGLGSAAYTSSTDYVKTAYNQGTYNTNYGILFTDTISASTNTGGYAYRNAEIRAKFRPPTTSARGWAEIYLGNAETTNATGSTGWLGIYNSSGKLTDLSAADGSSDTVQYLPNVSGTILNSGTTSFTQTQTSGTKIGSIKINGTSTDIYAPSSYVPMETVTTDVSANTYFTKTAWVNWNKNAGTSTTDLPTTNWGILLTKALPSVQVWIPDNASGIYFRRKANASTDPTAWWGITGTTGDTYDLSNMSNTGLGFKTLSSRAAIDATAGSFIFGTGALAAGSGADWVGFQADAGYDRFQLIPYGASLLYREDDDPASQTSTWGDFKALQSLENVTGSEGITVTHTSVTIGTGSDKITFNSGAVVKHTNSITAGTAKGDNSKTLTFGGTFTIPSITYDANGHITTWTTTTMTMPSNPNTNTTYTLGTSGNNVTLTPSSGSVQSITVPYATRSSYIDIVASNEVRFSVATKPANATDIHIGHAWSDGTSDAKINTYVFKNGGAGLALIKSKGYYLVDSGGNTYTGLYDNGSNLWIGSTQTQAKHHIGQTYISAGYNSANSVGNSTIYISVPTSANNNGTNYAVLHAGNFTTTGSGNAITSVAFTNEKLTFTKGSTFSLSTHTHNYAGSASAGGPASSVATTEANANADRVVFFADNTDTKKLVYDNDFKYNPSTNELTAQKFKGSLLRYHPSADLSTAGTDTTVSVTEYPSYTFSYVQTPAIFGGTDGRMGDSSGNWWAHYAVMSHGNGNSQYRYILRFPFWGAPQYQRPTATSSNERWRNILTDETGAGGDYFLAYPVNGYYYSHGGATGAIDITLPVGPGMMISFSVDIWDYAANKSCTYKIAGYGYASDNKWYNTTAYCIGKPTHSMAIPVVSSGGQTEITNLNVRFGYNNTSKKLKVQIGETDTSWSYLAVQIHDVTFCYGTTYFSTISKGWSIGLVTSNIPNVTSTIKATNIAYHASAIALTHGNECNFTGPSSGTTNIWFGYRKADVDGTETNTAYISRYLFGNGNNTAIAGITCGDIIINTATSGTPTLSFIRGTTSDNYYDWRLRDSGGDFYFDVCTGSNTWTSRAWFPYGSNNFTIIGSMSLKNGSYTATVQPSTMTANRTIVLPDKSGGLPVSNVIYESSTGTQAPVVAEAKGYKYFIVTVYHGTLGEQTAMITPNQSITDHCYFSWTHIDDSQSASLRIAGAHIKVEPASSTNSITFTVYISDRHIVAPGNTSTISSTATSGTPVIRKIIGFM